MSGIYKTADGARAIQERYLAFLDRWPVPSRHLRVPTREGETFVVACGPEGAPPLLLLHGSGANAAMWMSDVAAWAEHFCIYAVDMIGEPGLSAPSRPPQASEAYALWLDDVMRELSLPRASMVGVSLGGWLTLDYATRRPDRVERVVLLCPSGVGRQRASFIVKAVALLMFGQWGRRRLLTLATGQAPVDEEFGRFVSLIFRHFKPRTGKIPIFGDDMLRRLTMPMLVILGGRDALLDSRGTRRRLQRLAPHLQVRFIPEAGHVIPGQTAPIQEFLRS